MKAKRQVYGHKPEVISLTGVTAEWQIFINTDANQWTQ